MGAGLAMLWIPLLAISLGANSLQLGGLGFAGSMSFTLFSLIFGRLSDWSGYKRLALLGSLVNLVVILLLFFSPRLYHLYILFALMTMSGGMFWPALVAWLAHSDTQESLPRKMTRYNIAWCTGGAFGPLITGTLFQLDYRFPLYIAILVSLAVSLLILSRPEQVDENANPKAKRPLPSVEYPTDQKRDLKQRSSYTYAAWIANFSSFFAVGTLRYLFPKVSLEIGFQPSILGALLFLMMAAQVLIFYLLGRSSHWHYRLAFLILFQILMMAGLILIFLSNSLFLLVIAFILIGANLSLTNFSSILYSMNTLRNWGTRGGIHAAFLGSGGFLGPLIGGILSQAYTLRTPYLAAVFVLAWAIIAEIMLIVPRNK